MEKYSREKFDRIVQTMVLWAEQWQTFILQHGDTLDAEQTVYARSVGVAAPEKVRVLKVPNVPLPHYKILRQTFAENDMLAPDANGLTLGFGVFTRQDAFPLEYWLTHELVHVAQCERAGGLQIAMQQYLDECLTIGYAESPMEKQAHSTALECLKQHNPNLFRLITQDG